MKKLLAILCFGCLCVTIISAQKLEKEVETAIGNFATNLPRGVIIEVSIEEMTLEGKSTSQFSRYLYELVHHYAVLNKNSFKVISKVNSVSRAPNSPGGSQRGIIKGTYAKRNDTVEVSLVLVQVSGTIETSIDSKRFDFPLAELTKKGISLEPENYAEIVKQEQIFAKIEESDSNKTNNSTVSVNPANQAVNIQAVFNSQSMTYMHADELKLTVSADRDCYFKIIHIDVNNKIKMIFPNKDDNKNSIRANENREVFGSVNNRQILCEPYGAETIVVVASIAQFPNLEQEYNQPWKDATEDNIKASIAGAGQERYSITILKPDEEYEYAKPENMTVIYQGIRDDTVKQKGYFEGNDKSGFYIINNIRGSYRIPSDRPDIIQFASYSLDKYTVDSNRGKRTRSSPYNFSFDKPQDINMAVQSVRSNILECGGTFTGNEKQGNFKAKGITGQYKVSNLVNVTITDKPFVVPNSMIEREVKSYFME